MSDKPGRRERFTDEEAAFLRYVRFGELPPRVLPSEMVETVETEAPDISDQRSFDPYNPAVIRPIR